MTLEQLLLLSSVREKPKVSPMLATLILKPFSDPDFYFEIKWDGYRAIADIENGVVQLYSRNNKSFNKRFPAVVENLEKSPNAIFDGEIVVVDESGRSSFELLQNFQIGEGGSLLYYIFDILYFENRDLTQVPLEIRKKILKEVLPIAPNIRLSEHIEEEGEKFYSIAKKEKLEGVIAKNKNSTYQMGRRGRDWLKIKIVMEQEAVIAGYTEPKGARKGFGSLVLGVYEGSELVYIGHSGGGFSEKEIVFMLDRMRPLIVSDSPFFELPKLQGKITWIKPELVCEVKFQEWTKEGVMRQPIFLGLREDKLASEVKREYPGE